MEYRIGTKVFKDWEITKEIGQGGFGTVFEIEKNNYGVKVKSALKVIKVPRSSSEVRAALSEGMDEQSVTAYFQGFVDEVVREIELMSSLKSHPAIVGYEDHAVIPYEDGIGWDILIRMELLTPVMDYQMNHIMDESTVVKMAKQITNLLAYCQSKGMIHRDIKPENIFVNEFGQFKLGDFGVARTIEKTSGGLSKKGTESYMAPEVYKGQPYGASVDIYSLGLVLYRYMNNNRLPFFPPAPQPISYSDKEKALESRMSGQPVAPPVNGSDEFSKIILKACSYRPENRFYSAQEMLNALNMLSLGEHSVKSVNQDVKPVDVQNTPQEEKTVGMYGGMPQEEKTVGMYGGMPQEEKTVGMYGGIPQEEKTVGMYGGMPQEEKTVGMYGSPQSQNLTGMYNNPQNQNSTGMYNNPQNQNSAGMYSNPRNQNSTGRYNTSSNGYQTSGSGIGNTRQQTKKKNKRIIIGIAAAVIFILGIIGSVAEQVYKIQQEEKQPEMVTVTVNGAEGSGTYEVGSVVTVTAEDRTDEGYAFIEWTVTSGEETLSPVQVQEAVFTVPEEGLNITAVYEEITDEIYVEMWENAVNTMLSGKGIVFGTDINEMSIEDAKDEFTMKGISYDDTYEGFITTENEEYDLTLYENASTGRINMADLYVYWYDEEAYNAIDFDALNSMFIAGDSEVCLGMSKEEVYAILGITEEMVEWLIEKMGTDTNLDWIDENSQTWSIYYSAYTYSDGEDINISFSRYDEDEYAYSYIGISQGHVRSLGFEKH